MFFQLRLGRHECALHHQVALVAARTVDHHVVSLPVPPKKA